VFIRNCLNSESDMKFVATYDALYGRMKSAIGCNVNVITCNEHFSVPIQFLIHDSISKALF